MDSLSQALNYELSHDLHFDQFAGSAQQMLENSKNAEASTPTITSLDALSQSEFLQKIGATILNSIQFKQQRGTQNFSAPAMDFDMAPNHVVLDSTSVNQLQQQLEYDKFMNEVWIGIVFTLILISMIFCICSCFLYHQFRTWKRNYHNNADNTQCTFIDVEALKLHPDAEDPVPEYTLVSGLPSYEAALELLHKKPQSSCLIVYPSVFNVFNRHEKASADMPATTTTATAAATTTTATTTQSHEAALAQTATLCEAAIPLLATAATTTAIDTTATATAATARATATTAPSTPTCETIKANFVLPIVPSYIEVFGGYQTIDEKKQQQTKQEQHVKDETLTHKNQNDK